MSSAHKTRININTNDCVVCMLLVLLPAIIMQDEYHIAALRTHVHGGDRARVRYCAAAGAAELGGRASFAPALLYTR